MGFSRRALVSSSLTFLVISSVQAQEELLPPPLPVEGEAAVEPIIPDVNGQVPEIADIPVIPAEEPEVASSEAPDFLMPGGEFEGKKITSVQIRYQGARTVSEQALRSFMATAPGQVYRQAMLDEDVRSLYESGLVDDVTFLAEQVGGGVRVIAEVSTRPGINGVGFMGNQIFSDQKLADISGLAPGQTLSDAKILAAQKKIQEHYRGYGYPDVVVSHRLQRAGAGGNADFVFVIEEGVKSEVRKILFQGNQAISDVELRREMRTKQKGWFSFLTKSGRINGEQLRADLELVADHYRSKGYWKVVVGEPQRQPVGSDQVDLIIPVQEGMRYTVRGVGFGPMKVFRPEELHPALSLVGEMPYSSQKVRDDIRMIRSYYGSRGYADAKVTPDVRDLGNGQVDIYYRITEGRPYRVGRVNIQGNTKSRDRVIRREVPMKPGQPFNSVDLETTKRRLENLRYFEPNGVQVSSSASPTPGYRDVDIMVNEKRTGSINFGVGFSSIDNLVGFINLEQTNFDITNWPSFTGAGQRFSVSVRAGTERQDLRLSFVEPWFLGQKLSLGTDLYYRDLLFLSDQYDQSELGASVSLRKPLGRRSYLKGQYSIENIEIDVDSDTPAASLFWPAEGDYLKSALELNYVYDSRDSNALPRKGHKVETGVSLAGGVFGGDVDTYTVSFDGQKHWNFAYDTILTLRGEAVVVDSYGDEDVPLFDLMALGGARNLRGFDYRNIGPRDAATNEVLGGQTSAYLTLELTFPVVDSVRGAVFYDLGVVNEDAWDFSASDLASDVGVGVRLDLPIGPLAFDYAFPVTSPDDEADEGGQFNFYLNYQY